MIFICNVASDLCFGYFFFFLQNVCRSALDVVFVHIWTFRSSVFNSIEIAILRSIVATQNQHTDSELVKILLVQLIYFINKEKHKIKKKILEKDLLKLVFCTAGAERCKSVNLFIVFHNWLGENLSLFLQNTSTN